MRWFVYGHLPEGPPKATSRLFAGLAQELDRDLPNGAEKSFALRHLLVAKDAAVRAAIEGAPGG